MTHSLLTTFNLCLAFVPPPPVQQKRELVDLATVSDQEIKNDDVIYMVFMKEGAGGWEELQVDQLLPFGDGDQGPANP